MDIIQSSDDLRQSIAAGLTDVLPEIQDRIYKRILELLDEYDTKGGYFEPGDTNKRQLLRIQAEIEAILKDAGYFKAANIYIANLAKISANTIALHESLNGLDIAKSSLSGIEKIYAENAINQMSEAGLSTHFIQPVTTVVNEAVSFGYSIEKTRETLRDFITTNETGAGKLESYLTTTARDTVTQLQGAQHQAISREFEMPLIRYVGGLLKDSRGQCVRWYGMKYIEVKDLEAEIEKAFALGKTKAEGPKGHKWSGMIKDTTPENFLIRRGGWGCMHQAIPVRKRAKK